MHGRVPAKCACRKLQQGLSVGHSPAQCRYRKRGVNDKGQVANDVETEQILHAGQDRRTGMPLLSSAVQASSRAGIHAVRAVMYRGKNCLCYCCVPYMQASMWLWHCAHCPSGRLACSNCGPLCRQETSCFSKCSCASLLGSHPCCSLMSRLVSHWLRHAGVVPAWGSSTSYSTATAKLRASSCG